VWQSEAAARLMGYTWCDPHSDEASCMPGDLKLSKIKQIALVMHDVEGAVPFYKDGLGLTLSFKIAGMAFFDAGGVRLMLTKPSAPEFDHKNSILYFEVAAIERAYESLKARGVPFISEPHIVGRTATHEIWICDCRDPEGNVLALTEERKF
jgi:predicted enzyme related to lactoylglutathione lyase